MKPRIGLAFNGRRGAEGVPDDTYVEWDEETTVAAVEAALTEAGDVVRLEARSDFPFRLHETRPDIVFNIAEGLVGPNRESHVPAFCEFWGVPYTGSDPMSLSACLDKGRAKEILTYHGIPTADFAVVADPAETSELPRLPVVVKPVHEGSSKGITQRSFCRTRLEVESEVRTILARYGQPALVERWLPGREFTCAVLGNRDTARVLPVVELDFDVLPPSAVRLYSYEAKWVWDTPEQPLAIFRCPAQISGALATELHELSLAAYRVLRCRDWARVDIRCDGRGRAYVLEVNPLPGILPDPAMNSCFPKAARAAGLSYTAMILAVLHEAATRYGLTLEVAGPHDRRGGRV